MKLKWILILIPFLGLFMNFDQDLMEPHCLEVDLKVITGNITEDPFRAILINKDKPFDSMTVVNDQNFKFLLKRNQTYNIMITKEGFVPRKLVISTNIEDSVYHKELYKLKFDLDLIDLEFVRGISIGYFDEPIVIVFDNRTRWFAKPNDPNLGKSYGFESGIENVFQCKSDRQ